MWAALNNWKKWTEYLATHSWTKQQAEEEILLAAFVQGQSAASGPLATWNKFEWLHRHLKAAVPLAVVPKPPKKRGDDGIGRQNRQAVAMPPEFLMA